MSDAAALVGKWVVTALRRDDELVSTLAESEITLVLAADGSLVGSGGCNVYRASYTLDGDAIAIVHPFSTRKACLRPEGVMEQEAAYLRALPEARCYRLDGVSFHLLTADGTIVATLSRAP